MIGVVIIEHTERERKAYKVIVTHILSSMKIDFAYPKAEFLLDSFQEEQPRRSAAVCCREGCCGWGFTWLSIAFAKFEAG
jgi:hypothetical protein